MESKPARKQDKYDLGLARRPKQSNNVSKIGTKVQMATNMYQVEIDKSKCTIHHYDVSFIPEIKDDNTRQKHKVIRWIDEQVKKNIGEYVHSGNSIFADKKVQDRIVIDYQGKDSYTVYLQLVGTYNLNDAYAYEGHSNEVCMVLNTKIKSVLRNMGLQEIGKNARFYNTQQVFNNQVTGKDREDLGLCVWRGYKTSFNLCQKNTLLQVDFASRVIRRENGLDVIKRLQFNQEDVKDYFQGRSVIANYGNMRPWRIDKVDFQINCDLKFTDDEGVSYTLQDYFLKAYNVKIKEGKQPIFVNYRRKDKKTGELIDPAYLVPELMLLTGLEDEEVRDGNLMRAVANYTKLDAQQRNDVISDQIGQMMKELQRTGLKIINQSPQVDATLLNTPSLTIGNNRTVSIPSNAQFVLKDKIHTPSQLSNWVIVYSSRGKRDDQECDDFVDNLKKAAGAYGIVVEDPGYITVSSLNAKDWISVINEDIKKNGKPLFIMSFIPKNAKATLYPQLKEEYYNRQGIPHQNVVIQSLMKNAMSVCSKILIQVSAKLGNPVWITPIPNQVKGNTMLIGIDFFHQQVPIPDQKGKKQKGSCAGFVASLDANFNQYYSQVCINPKNLMFKGLADTTVDAVKAYAQKNKQLPETIIVYRDGISEGQVNFVVLEEVEAIYQGLTSIDKDYKPKFAFIIINKKINTRFFHSQTGGSGSGGQNRGGNGGKNTSSGQYVNPPSGTVVSSGVTSQGFDFLLCPQQVTQGTSNPVHFQVLRDSTGWPEDVFWQLTFFQCFNYYNWFGAVQVPACVQYAHKLAYLVGDTFKDNVHAALVNTLFYL